MPGQRTVLALPGFDEFLLGYADRSLVLPPEHADKIVPGGNGMFKKTIVAGGRVIGTWAGPARRPAAPPSCPNRSTPLTGCGLPPKSPLSCRPRSTCRFLGG